jgi:hypothetical protein
MIHTGGNFASSSRITCSNSRPWFDLGMEESVWIYASYIVSPKQPKLTPSFCVSDATSSVRAGIKCLFGIIENIGEMAPAAVLAIVVGCHKDTSAALS